MQWVKFSTNRVGIDRLSVLRIPGGFVEHFWALYCLEVSIVSKWHPVLIIFRFGDFRKRSHSEGASKTLLEGRSNKHDCNVQCERYDLS